MQGNLRLECVKRNFILYDVFKDTYLSIVLPMVVIEFTIIIAANGSEYDFIISFVRYDFHSLPNHIRDSSL